MGPFGVFDDFVENGSIDRSHGADVPLSDATRRGQRNPDSPRTPHEADASRKHDHSILLGPVHGGSHLAPGPAPGRADEASLA